MIKLIQSVLTVISIGFIGVSYSGLSFAAKTAQYANVNYDVVYVRCPRGLEPVNWKGSEDVLNWNGVNDMWLSASNNIYHQPGCDLVLHHSDPAYGGGLAMGDIGREEVLVNCDETDNSTPSCSISDPNVSLDAKTIVYTKFTDTRTFMDGVGLYGNGGWGPIANHMQAYVRLFPDGSSGYGKRVDSQLIPYAAPALVFKFDLVTKTETQVSPDAKMFGGRAFPGKDPDWASNIPVMDTGPFFMHDGRIGFTSNRESGFYRFQLFVMDDNGQNMDVLSHRAMNQQLHPFVLKDGRISYTSFDPMLQKVGNNQYSLFNINPDGSFPFILAGKHDSTNVSYHYATQLSDGAIVTTLYYNHNNGGMGSLIRFPIDPPGADFENKVYPAGWRMGNSTSRFTRVGQFDLTPDALKGDSPQKAYKDSSDYWNHPSRSVNGREKIISGQKVYPDKALVTMTGRFTHPAAAPDNDMLVTYTIGSSSVMGGYSGTLDEVMETVGKDGGVWLIPLEPNSTRQVSHIADDGKIIVDFPEYHEIYPRALVSYDRIYGVTRPGLKADGSETDFIKVKANVGKQDSRILAGSPYGLSGASSMYDRETRAANGTPWNMLDGGGVMSGRTYLNLGASGAELAIFDNSEVYGVRVTMPVAGIPGGYGGSVDGWAGAQRHHLRILGEFPVRKSDGTLLDSQGNPDTSFVVKLPANTPFLFQSLDKYGMALDIETTSRSVVRGERQLCIGCHVHTREGMDPVASVAVQDQNAAYGDFSGTSAPLFEGFDTNGNPTVNTAKAIYNESVAPGVSHRRTFAADWNNGVSQIIQNRCSACHAEGKSAQQATGLRLDGDERTYDLLLKNKYTREDGVKITDSTKPGDGLNDVINEVAGTDRITKRYSCCTDSRWVSFNSARSSMLIWALYGERLDGRNPETGMPWGAAGEVVPSDKQGLTGVPVDSDGRDHPEVWPKVAEHLSYVSDMSESEKRLLARWIDIGSPKLNVHDDMTKPVITVTPISVDGTVSTILVGLWDDSKLDYSSFKATYNGSNIAPSLSEGQEVVSLTLPSPISTANANSVDLFLEIWDSPNRDHSLVKPGAVAKNRSRLSLTGKGILRMVNENCDDCTPLARPSAPSGLMLKVVN